jgi:YHS domain-containing protein
MKNFILAVALAATSPALAHGKAGEHAKKGQHRDAPVSFDSKPAVGTWAKCPVSGDVFKIAPDTEFATYEGRVYAFCCEECKPDFDKNPAKFAGKRKTGPASVN